MGKRSEVSDRSLRQLMQKRKERIHSQQEEEIARQQDEAARFKREDEDTDRKKVRKPGGKRNHDEMDLDHDEDVPQESLPTVGAHGPARQDGVGVHEGERSHAFASLPITEGHPFTGTSWPSVPALPPYQTMRPLIYRLTHVFTVRAG